jgi:hypothetical protein
MRSIFPVLSLSACLLILTACDGPFIFAAGGELSGTVTEAPNKWQLDEDSAVAQLETRPEDPYSINFTYIQLDGRFYVYAGDTRTNWVKHIEQSPLVRVRVQDNIYPARAIRVMSDEELSEFAGVWANLSVFQRNPMNFEEVWLYRLEAR